MTHKTKPPTMLTVDEIEQAFEKAFSRHELHQESVDFAREIEVAVRAQFTEHIQRLEAEVEARQAKIDALMFEFCPGEMTAEQLERWASHQKAALTTTADNQPETGKE